MSGLNKGLSLATFKASYYGDLTRCLARDPVNCSWSASEKCVTHPRRTKPYSKARPLGDMHSADLTQEIPEVGCILRDPA